MDAAKLDREARLRQLIRRVQSDLVLMGVTPARIQEMSFREQLELYADLEQQKQAVLKELMGAPRSSRG